MKKILVTGGSGFIGSPVVQRLVRSGYEVHAVSRCAKPPIGDVQWHAAGVLDGFAMDQVMLAVQPTHLLHMAWVTEHGQYWSDPLNSAWLTASLHLLKVFGRIGGQRVVSIGTCAEYDWTQPAPFREDAPLAPTSLYGAAKASLGWMQQQLAHRSGFQQAWCRPFFLYGPGEDPARLIPSLASAVLRGEPPGCNNPGAIRDFLHVEDVAEAIVTVMDSEYEGPANIGSGEGVSLGSIAQMFSELAGLPPTSVPFCDNADRVVADASVVAALGFRPRHTLRSGLADTLRWWRDRMNVVAY